MPKKFKRLLEQKNKQPRAPKAEPARADKDDVWAIRAGETFREFNARIRNAGLTLPPGVPQTLRGDPSQHRPPQTQPPAPPSFPSRQRAEKPAMLFSAEKGPADAPDLAYGERSKQRRKEYQRNKKETKRREREEDEADRVPPPPKRRLGDVVQAPPSLKTTPKATLKLAERPSKGHKRASLLPLIGK